MHPTIASSYRNEAVTVALVNDRRLMSAFIITRIEVGDYDAWRPMFDQDRPRAREKARAQRVFRGTDDPVKSVSLVAIKR
jgi:hypothetical protein